MIHMDGYWPPFLTKPLSINVPETRTMPKSDDVYFRSPSSKTLCVTHTFVVGKGLNFPNY